MPAIEHWDPISTIKHWMHKRKYRQSDRVYIYISIHI